jgi:GT2 family glycosyltransferase
MIKGLSVSILIPVKGDNKNLRECIEACLRLDYADFEIVVLPDEIINLPYAGRVKVIPMGEVGPAAKRDMAIKGLKGAILAFLDDDAYPDKDWLNNAVRHFGEEAIAAVCGPAVTPDSDALRQKASGDVYSSFIVSGAHTRRYIPRPACEVEDYPSCNFLMRRDIFEESGGFNTSFWPGEDTVLCLKVTKELKKKIIYDPDVLVYHHRRPLFAPHLRQIKNYALHRGYFVKRFPQTSLKATYFFPSIFAAGLAIGGIVSIFSPLLRAFYFQVISAYLIVTLYNAFKYSSSPRARFPVFLGIVLTHLTYGVYFIKGLFTGRLAEENG